MGYSPPMNMETNMDKIQDLQASLDMAGLIYIGSRKPELLGDDAIAAILVAVHQMDPHVDILAPFEEAYPKPWPACVTAFLMLARSANTTGKEASEKLGLDPDDMSDILLAQMLQRIAVCFELSHDDVAQLFTKNFQEAKNAPNE